MSGTEATSRRFRFDSNGDDDNEDGGDDVGDDDDDADGEASALVPLWRCGEIATSVALVVVGGGGSYG